MDITARIIAQEPGRITRAGEQQYVFTMDAEAAAGIILALDNGDVKSAFASAVANAQDLATGATASDFWNTDGWPVNHDPVLCGGIKCGCKCISCFDQEKHRCTCKFCPCSS